MKRHVCCEQLFDQQIISYSFLIVEDSMPRLIEKITSEFDLESYIEVYVLDKSGDPFEIYSGLCENISNAVFEKILTSSGCLYAFIVIAKSSNTGSIDSRNEDMIIRKEFCWLTDPLPPVAQTSKNNSISVQWQPVQFCGVDVKLADDSLQYILEGAEGHEWKGGMASKFVTENTFMEYRLMCRGPTLLHAVIEDLKPANWYHFRVAIEYMGVRVTSDSKSICTLCSIPSPPAKPRVQVIPGTKSMQNKSGLTETKVRILWVAPICNGSSIKKYHAQLQEVLLVDNRLYQDNAGSIITSTTTPPTALKSQNDEKFQINNWQTVYCNLLNEVTLSAPLPWRLEWRIRVRAKNANGWSAYSPTLTINTNSHPSLFQTAFQFQKSNSINHSNSILSSLNLPNISHHSSTTKPTTNSYNNKEDENNQNPSTDIITPQSTRRENETSLGSLNNNTNSQKLFTSTNKVQNKNYNYHQDNEKNIDSKYKQQSDHKTRLPFQVSKSNEFDFLDDDYYQDEDNNMVGKRMQSGGDPKTRTAMDGNQPRTSILIKSNNSSTNSSSNKIDLKSDKVNKASSSAQPAPSKKSTVTIQEDNHKLNNHPLLSALSTSLSNTYPMKTGQKLKLKSKSENGNGRPSTTPMIPTNRPISPSSFMNLSDIPIEMNDTNNSFQKSFIMSEVDRVGFGTPISTNFIKTLLEPILKHIAVQTENGTLTKS